MKRPSIIIGRTRRTKQNTTQKLAVAPAPRTIYEERNAEIASRLVISDLPVRERAFLAACQMIYRDDCGSDTPIENFITRLVSWIEFGNWPSPEDVRSELKIFEGNFADALLRVELFLRHYPENHPAWRSEDASKGARSDA